MLSLAEAPAQPSQTVSPANTQVGYWGAKAQRGIQPLFTDATGHRHEMPLNLNNLPPSLVPCTFSGGAESHGAFDPFAELASKHVALDPFTLPTANGDTRSGSSSGKPHHHSTGGGGGGVVGHAGEHQPRLPERCLTSHGSGGSRGASQATTPIAATTGGASRRSGQFDPFADFLNGSGVDDPLGSAAARSSQGTAGCASSHQQQQQQQQPQQSIGDLLGDDDLFVGAPSSTAEREGADVRWRRV
jgi:hypothetical protein